MSGPAVSILSEIACHLGEGPSYDPATDTLWWFDIVGKRLLEHPFPHNQTIVHDLPVMASAIAVVDGDRHLIVAEDGLYLHHARTGALVLHRPVEADNPATRSNDARVHPCGALWFGTMGKNAEKKAGAIYWHFQGEIRLLYPEISIPNSICFSADGSVAFFADTAKNILFRVACDPETSLPDGEPAVFLDHRSKPGGLDGSVMDRDGVIWNARWGSGALDAYGPDGECVMTVAIPAHQVSCPAFLGKNADRMAVTSAYQNMDEVARIADPHAGKTFLVDWPFKGRFEPKALL